MTAMRVSVLRDVGEVVTEERPVPQAGPREVLVEVDTVGTCGSDVHYYQHGRIGDFVVREPLILGHEPSGVIVAVGAEVDRERLGQRVSIEPGVPCLSCARCRLGRYNLCQRMRFFGTPPVDGAFSEYVTIHEQFAHRVPDTLSAEAAALLEPLSVAVWACTKAQVSPGSRVLVTGAGPIGLVALQTALAFGATEVVVSDVRSHRLSVAGRLGGLPVDAREHTLDGVEPDALLECSGVPQVAADGIRLVRPAGRAVLVGMGGDEIPLPLAHVQQNEIEVTGTFRYANTWPQAIALAASEVDLDRLVTHRFGLDEVRDAFEVQRLDDTAIKAMVSPRA